MTFPMKLLRKLIGYNLALRPLSPPRHSRRRRLVDLLRHANTHTPFYKGAFDAFLDAETDLTDEEFFYAYSHLPILEKHHLKEHNEAFKSDHLEDKVNLLADGQTPSLKDFIKHALIQKDFCASISTGGSSGVPAFRWLDYDDANVFAQSFLHSFKLNGWKTGESFVVYYPLKSYFTGAYADHADSLNRYFGFTMVPFEHVTKESVLELLDTLKAQKATLLVIFPCVLQRIAEIMYHEGIEPFADLPYINVSGEFFLDCSKTFIQKMFPDSDIQSTYGAVEFGEIAHQKGLNSYNYNVFDNYAFLEQGPNNSLLVTSYRQRAFPLIRYKIEDLGTVVNNDDGTQCLLSLEGKNTDYLIGADNYMYFASYFNSFINDVNARLNDPIIHFALRHGKDNGLKYMHLNFVLADPEKKEQIYQAAMGTMRTTFANYDRIEVHFPHSFNHDYTRKFKIIGEGDGLAEVVGGYYQHKAAS